jgi:hypothetical protein
MGALLNYKTSSNVYINTIKVIGDFTNGFMTKEEMDWLYFCGLVLCQDLVQVKMRK